MARAIATLLDSISLSRSERDVGRREKTYLPSAFYRVTRMLLMTQQVCLSTQKVSKG